MHGSCHTTPSGSGNEYTPTFCALTFCGHLHPGVIATDVLDATVTHMKRYIKGAFDSYTRGGEALCRVCADEATAVVGVDLVLSTVIAYEDFARLMDESMCQLAAERLGSVYLRDGETLTRTRPDGAVRLTTARRGAASLPTRVRAANVAGFMMSALRYEDGHTCMAPLMFTGAPSTMSSGANMERSTTTSFLSLAPIDDGHTTMRVRHHTLTPVCATCLAVAAAADARLLRCSRCLRVYYCSTECQRRAWRQHKRECIA